MKIKTDFVTNSSSSSFIVLFPKKVKSRIDVEKYIKNENFIPVITDDCLSQKPKVASLNKKIIKYIADELEYGYIPEVRSCDYDKKFCKKNGITIEELRQNRQWTQLMYKEMDMLKKAICKQMAIDLINKNEGHYVYTFEYSDNDGEIYSQLEHENNWGDLPHIKINRH